MTSNTTTIRPLLIVSNAEKAVAFYIAAFGAVETNRFALPDEKLSAVIEIEQAVLYVSDEEPEYENVSPSLISNSPVRVILETKNADRLFENALQHGATQICPMATEDDWRIGKLKDPFGHIWEVGYSI